MPELDDAERASPPEADGQSRPTRKRPKGRVVVFENWCKGCGICIEFCPANVLTANGDGRPRVTAPERCMACRWCEFRCPDLAIMVEDVDGPEGGVQMTAQLLQGNRAFAEGAIAAGCRFFAGYPITPSSEVAEVMARRLPALDGTFIQMEDEIASLAAVIGASVGGEKAMTATSGPGFSLMQENLGYAVMAEVPCVIVNVQRLGPSTGKPTSPSQGDVMQARWGTHGDHPIIVLCPASVKECFELTVTAFNFSERYRTPVIVLSDEVIGHMQERVELPDPGSVEVWDRMGSSVPPEWYRPYRETPSDVPPLVPFGEGYRYHITGLYHDVFGFPTQRLDETQAWVQRVFRKLDRNLGQITLFEAEWMEDAKAVVVSYGTSARAAREGVRIARTKYHRKVGFLKLKTLWPFPEELIERVGLGARRVVVAEMNLGQLSLEVERVVGMRKVRRVLRADGELIHPDQIVEAIRAK